jgi:hypothetical protein
MSLRAMRWCIERSQACGTRPHIRNSTGPDRKNYSCDCRMPRRSTPSLRDGSTQTGRRQDHATQTGHRPKGATQTEHRQNGAAQTGHRQDRPALRRLRSRLGEHRQRLDAAFATQTSRARLCRSIDTGSQLAVFSDVAMNMTASLSGSRSALLKPAYLEFESL